MKNMIYFWILLGVLATLCIMGLRIETNPFKIYFTEFWWGLGWLLMIIAISIIKIDATVKGHEEGYSKGSKDTRDSIANYVEKLIKEEKDGKKAEK